MSKQQIFTSGQPVEERQTDSQLWIEGKYLRWDSPSNMHMIEIAGKLRLIADSLIRKMPSR